MRDVAALSAEDRLHVHHAWQQAEDAHEIDRCHVDGCVRLGFMEKTAPRYWEFTLDGIAVAEKLYEMWSAGTFDPVTGTIGAQATQGPETEPTE